MRDNRAWVHFRLSLIARHVSLHPDGIEPLALHLRLDHELQATLASIEIERDVALECVVLTEFDPSDRVQEVFEHLAAGRLPPGHLPREQWTHDMEYIDAEGNIDGRFVVPLYLMPSGFQDFARHLTTELRRAADAAFGVLRWRSRTVGSSQPFASRGCEWSIDAAEWQPMPSATTVELGDVARLEITPAAAGELQGLLDAGEFEPLAHVLFREAWGQRRANPRSSLLIGMTALEVGIKQYIAACVPEATWLAENVPTPPVIAMLQDYLPTLQPPAEGRQLERFDDTTIDALRIGVTIRNQLSHRGADVARDRLLTTLRAVRNVLWSLDHARGHDWASAYLTTSLEHDLSVGYRRV